MSRAETSRRRLLEHVNGKPTFEYVNAEHTDIRKTFERVRAELTAEAVKVSNVKPIREHIDKLRRT